MKKICTTFQIILLIWFFLDMVGVSFGKNHLVTQSYKDDGVFFLVYFATVVLFIAKDEIGKWLVIISTFVFINKSKAKKQ